MATKRTAHERLITGSAGEQTQGCRSRSKQTGSWYKQRETKPDPDLVRDAGCCESVLPVLPSYGSMAEGGKRLLGSCTKASTAKKDGRHIGLPERRMTEDLRGRALKTEISIKTATLAGRLLTVICRRPSRGSSSVQCRPLYSARRGAEGLPSPERAPGLARDHHAILSSDAPRKICCS